MVGQALSSVLLTVALLHAQVLDRPPAANQVPYYPEDGATVTMNPPAFVWVPVSGAAEYVLELSRSSDFAEPGTIRLTTAISLQVPRTVLEPGRWHWRYGVRGAFSRTRSFTVPPGAPVVPFPDVGEVVRKLSASRPRIGVSAAELESVRARARGGMQWAVKNLAASAANAIGGPLLPEPEFLPARDDPSRGPIYQRTFQATRRFFAGMFDSAEAHLLTGEERFGQEARRRLMHIMSWDPEGSTSLDHNDEPGTDIVRAASRTYDYIYPLLSEEERSKVREVLAVRLPQPYRALRRRPFESNPFESHAMDYYIRDLAEGVIAMAGEFPVEPMLEYLLLQLWSPYYPPFGGEDGGWSEGPSYWSWSTANFVRTFLLVERATGARLTHRTWLRNTPYFKLYANPPYSRTSPFGDGSNGVPPGFDTQYYLGAALSNPYALWYAAQRSFRPRGVNAFLFDPGELKPRPPDDLPQARAFADAGIAAMHSELASANRNVWLLLRSSAYGSMSHGFADQNAFVLSAFGEPLAISTGYYDYYSSPHHQEWTRQTRAANSITVDGEGQFTRRRDAAGNIARLPRTTTPTTRWEMPSAPMRGA